MRPAAGPGASPKYAAVEERLWHSLHASPVQRWVNLPRLGSAIRGGADVARSFVAPFPDARLELVPGAGHAIWMDDPSGAADAVAAFLEE